MARNSPNELRVLRHPERIAFASQFRAARAGALRNAEAFEEHLYVMERLGSYLTGSHGDLRKYQPCLEDLASDSPLACDAERACPELHLGFTALYEEARFGRNDAMHQGAIARHLARNAQELALIMEDALMSSAKKTREFMVRDPMCAELWHPLSAIRRTMLLNAFSFLPFQLEGGSWQLVSDSSLVRFMRGSGIDRKKCLLMSLESALKDGLVTTKPLMCDMDESVEKLAARIKNTPCLVVDGKNRLLGLMTAFDLL